VPKAGGFEMAILEILDSLDGVAEDQKASFNEVDGKFQRAVEIEDVSGLKSALQKERDAKREYERKLELYKDVDPEKYADLLKKQEDGLTELERYENAIKKQKDEIDLLKTQSAAEKKELEAKLQKFHADKEARKAALEAGVIPEDIDDVLILTRSIRSMDEDGNIVIIDADGDPTGKTLKDFFEKDFKETKPKYYPGLPGGSGASGGAGSAKVDLSKMTPTQRLDHSRGLT